MFSVSSLASLAGVHKRFRLTMMKTPNVNLLLFIVLAFLSARGALYAQKGGMDDNGAIEQMERKERLVDDWTYCDVPSLRCIRRNAAERFNLRLKIALDKSVKESDELRIAFCLSSAMELGNKGRKTADSHYCARIRRDDITLVKIKAGTVKQLGERRYVKDKLNDGRPHVILLKRRKEKIALFLDNAIAVTGHDKELSRGEIALGRIGDSIKVRDLKYQKIGDIHFSDDFMRVGGPGATWTKVKGEWALSHIRNVERSSNPFRCVGRGSGDALLVAGYDFWDDYAFQVSAKCDDGGSFGIAFYYKNPSEYFLLRWNGYQMQTDLPSKGGKLQILRVNEGKNDDAHSKSGAQTRTHIIAERNIPYRKGQWYKLTVKVSSQRAEAYIDAFKLFEVNDPNLCSGKIGLYASHTNGAYFDDVLVQSNASRALRKPIKLFSKVFENKQQMENWASIWSSWRPRPETIPPRMGGGERVIYWHKGDFFGDVSIGIDLDAVSPTKRDGRMDDVPNTELNLLVGGDGYSVKKGYWLHVESDDGRETSVFRLYRDMKTIAEKEIPVEMLASHRYISLKRKGDSVIAMLGSMEVLSSSTVGKDDTHKLNQKLQETPNASVSDSPNKQRAWQGERYRVSQPHIAHTTNGKRSGGESDTRYLTRETTGTKVALWSNRDIELHKVKIYSDDVYDYMFETAPVDWELQLGTWKVTNRWTCDPSWSWMGGASNQLALMWSKNEFHGDMTVEFFAAFQMEKGLRYPPLGDINLTICGDGENLNSGYSFIYAGWGNRWTRILKGDKVIAETDRFTIRSGGLFSSNFFKLHRNWFHIKVRKIGCSIQFYINGSLIREVIDPDPLSGGKVAIWTIGKGIIISRVRIYCADVRSTALIVDRSAQISVVNQNRFRQTSFEDRRDAAKSRGVVNKTKTRTSAVGNLGSYNRLTDFFIFNDFERGIGEWRNSSGEQGALLSLDRTTAASGHSSLKLTNTYCGGDFGAIITTRRYDLFKYPLLVFDYNIPRGVKINLYVKVLGRYYSVLLTGPQGEDANSYANIFGPISTIGKVDSVSTDSRWHHIEFNLLKALLRSGLKLGKKRLIVEEIAIGNLSNKDYLLCGFNGNSAGASYHIDNFGISRRKGNGQ